MRTLTVIAPVYNEEAVIESFYREVKQALAELSGRYSARFLFVVDRGTDGTLDVLRRLAAEDDRVGILALSSRFGHQASLLAGLDHCDSDLVVMLDSDLQHPPALIPRLVEEHERGFDIVYTLRTDAPGVSLFKRGSSKLFYRLLNRLSDVPINENGADYRLVTRRVVEVFRHQLRERNPFLRGLFAWVGFSSVGVPFAARRRPAGRTKYSTRRMLRFGIDGVVSFSKSPLQASIFVGVLIALFGLAVAAWTVFEHMQQRSFPPGWTTVVVLVSLFSGTQLVFLGIIGQYIAAIFDEVKGRPHYIVEERVNVGASNQTAG